MTNVSKVLQNAPFGAFCNTFDLHKAMIGLEKQFLVFFENGCFKQVLLYCNCFFEDAFFFAKQCNVVLCGISSGSSLFAKVSV